MATAFLPELLIVDILSRLPVKSLLRFRCVCKLWCDLITDPAFVKMHLNHSLASNSNLSLIFQDDYPPNDDLYYVELDAYQHQVVVELVHSFDSNEVQVVGSCNGLLCISVNFDEFFFWNPSTRRHQKLPSTPIYSPRVSHAPGHGMFDLLYGFGYDPTTDDYKLVSIVNDSFYMEVNIYSLSSNSWRSIEDIPFHSSVRPGTGVLANSAFHWIVEDGDGPAPVSSFLVVSFDLRDEERRDVPLPDIVDEFEMNIGVLGGQFCLLCNFSGIRVEVWVMKDYGVRDSWEKLFSIKLPSWLGVRPICYSKNGEVILEKDADSLVLYDPCRGRARKFRIRGYVPDRFETVPCVRSLVPLNAKDLTEQAERKKKNTLLKKRKKREQRWVWM